MASKESTAAQAAEAAYQQAHPTQDSASQASTPDSETPDSEAEAEASHQEPADSQAEAEAEAPQPDAAEKARKEAARAAFALRQREQKLKAREAEVERIVQREKEIAAREAELSELQQADDISLLERVAAAKGVKLEDLLRRSIQKLANGGEPTQEMVEQAMRDELASVRKRLEEFENREKEAARELEKQRIRSENERFLAQYRDATASAISADEHPILSAYDPTQIVMAAMRVADDYAGKTGEVPDVGEVLAYLEEQERTRYETIAKRVGSRATPEEMAAAAAAGKSPARVVTNAAAASRGAAPVDYRAMTERERISAAAAEVFGKK